MKKKWISVGVTAFALLGGMSLAVAASEEEPGYWTTRVDEQGDIVQIFVYTEPVEWEIVEDASLGCCGLEAPEDAAAAPEEPIAGTGQAERRLSGAQAVEATPAAGLAKAEDRAAEGSQEYALYGIALAGVLVLAGMGYALYKAV